jgi:hypothetical protein
MKKTFKKRRKGTPISRLPQYRFYGIIATPYGSKVQRSTRSRVQDIISFNYCLRPKNKYPSVVMHEPTASI